MARLILFIFLFITGKTLIAQDTAFQFKKYTAVQGSFTDFTADNVGNIYLIINREQIKKLNPNGDSVGVFSIKRYGNIATLDATNPLKILVYYKDASTIIILDKQLSVKATIDLRKSNIQQVKAIRLSYDNNIWLYDEAEGKIRKIDDKGRKLFETVDLRTFLTEAPSFSFITDDDKWLYLYDARQGWFVFDHYGALKKKYSFPGWRDVQVVNGVMTGRSDKLLFSVKSGDLDFKSMKPPFSLAGILKLYMDNKHTYILSPGKLEIYDAL